MGYRSDIYVKAKASCLFELTEALEKADLKDYVELTVEDDIISMKISDVKWYTGYKDVDIMNKIFYKLADEGSLGLIRLGEGRGDVEEIGNPWDFDMYTLTTIEGF